MKGEVDVLANFPIDTSLKKKAHSAMMTMMMLMVEMLKGGGSRDRSSCRLHFRPRVPLGILLTYQRQKGNMDY